MRIVKQGELAKEIGVHQNTIIKWTKKGYIKKLNIPGAFYDLDEVFKQLTSDEEVETEDSGVRDETMKNIAKNKNEENK